MANNPICSIQECGKPAKTRGLCGAHYNRLQRNGDPLAGRTPEGKPMKFIHQVALKSDVDDCINWPFHKTGNGYAFLAMGKKKCIVSRYVCEIVNGAPNDENHQAAHSCNNRSCVNPRHLRWATPSENQADKVIHGTVIRGERHPHAKLSDDQAREIIELKGIKTQQEIADEFGLSRNQVFRIQAGKCWGWLATRS